MQDFSGNSMILAEGLCVILLWAEKNEMPEAEKSLKKTGVWPSNKSKEESLSTKYGLGDRVGKIT